MSKAAVLFLIASSAWAIGQGISSLSLDAKEVATAVNTQRKWETDYGSYDRDYRKRITIEVTVRDFSRRSGAALVTVYFLARPLNGTERFIYAARELPINFKGELELTARVEAPSLKSSVQNYEILGAKYVAGSEIEGWVIVGEANGRVFEVKASRQPLLDLVARPGTESLASMIADFKAATTKKKR